MRWGTDQGALQRSLHNSNQTTNSQTFQPAGKGEWCSNTHSLSVHKAVLQMLSESVFYQNSKGKKEERLGRWGICRYVHCRVKGYWSSRGTEQEVTRAQQEPRQLSRIEPESWRIQESKDRPIKWWNSSVNYKQRTGIPWSQLKERARWWMCQHR